MEDLRSPTRPAGEGGAHPRPGAASLACPACPCPLICLPELGTHAGDRVHPCLPLLCPCRGMPSGHAGGCAWQAGRPQPCSLASSPTRPLASLLPLRISTVLQALYSNLPTLNAPVLTNMFET